MDIDALRTFIAFVDTGSFTRAARQVCRTQSAISMQMKKLEEDAGDSLFAREGRNLVLTAKGRLMASYARRIINLHDKALSELSCQDTAAPLVLGCPDDYAESVLPELISMLRAIQPGLTFVLRCDTSGALRRMLDAGELHLAVLTRAPEGEEGYLLKNDQGVWVHGGYPQLVHAPVLPLVLFDRDCKFHSSAIDGLEKQGRAYEIVATSYSATAIKGMLRQGVGISVLATASLTPDLTVLDAPELPPLAAADLVMALGAEPHPQVGAVRVAQLSKAWQAKYLQPALTPDVACVG